MGICLALSILETGEQSPHGGRPEAIDELIRESFWMTQAELSKAYTWALRNNSQMLRATVESELLYRRSNVVRICRES